MSKILSFLDTHLTLQILDFYIEKEIYPKEQLIQTKISVLQKTKLFSELKKLGETNSEKEKETESLLKKYEEDYKNSPYEKADQLLLLDYSKLSYETGNYEKSYDLLVHYKKVSTDTEKLLGTYWGRYASALKMKDWTKALQEYSFLKEAIESSNNEDDLLHRSWFLNWSLFLFFNLPNGKDLLLELFMADKF
jgi:translation initiation factor 3 subunit E